MSAPPPRWNHNTHYHALILGTVPDGCRRSLDVGCGEGMLARDLRRVVPHVTGIDRDAASIDVARRQDEGASIEYVLGDFMTHPFELWQHPKRGVLPNPRISRVSPHTPSGRRPEVLRNACELRRNLRAPERRADSQDGVYRRPRGPRPGSVRLPPRRRRMR